MSQGQRFLGQIAVELGHLRPEELELALELQGRFRALGKNYTVGDILIDRGFVTPDQLQECVAAQDSGPADESARVGDLIIANELATREQIEECLKIQRDIESIEGKKVPLATVLLKKGYIDQQQKNALLRLQDRLSRTAADGQETVELPAIRPVAPKPAASAPRTRRSSAAIAAKDEQLDEDYALDLSDDTGIRGGGDETDLNELIDADDDLYGTPTDKKVPGEEAAPAAPGQPAPKQSGTSLARKPQKIAFKPQATAGLQFQIFDDEQHCKRCGEIMLKNGVRCGQCDAKYCIVCKTYIGSALEDQCPPCYALADQREALSRRHQETKRREAFKKKETGIIIGVSVGVVILVIGILLLIIVL